MTTGADAVRAGYERLLGERRKDVARRSERVRLLSHLRLGVFALAAVLAVLALRGAPLAWVAGLTALGFVGLVLAHDSARREFVRAERAAAWYARALERLDYRFAGRGRDGARFAHPDHAYAPHLDLFGTGSLFELLSLAQTSAGEETLARWLLAPAPLEEIRARQTAVAELRPRLDLREDFARLGPELGEVRPHALAEWGAAPASVRPTPALRAAALALPSATLGAVALAWLAGAGLLPLVAVLSGQIAFALWLRPRVRRVLASVDRAARELALLVGLLERLERERFAAPRLVALRDALDTGGLPPSRRVAQLGRIVTLLDSRRNQIFALVAPFLLWTTQLALALEAWRLACGPRVGEWIRALGEFEALQDLAGHAYEHPDDPFPELVADAALLDATALGHPLLPEGVCVRNDVRLDRDGVSLLVVSGSNMSGKSTLVRSIGTAVVLALAGAPVRAERLRLSPLAVGASLRNPDSLLDGASHFYAEITCLKRIMGLLDGPLPLLFLFDEILQGTNSHDRRIGATSVVKQLLGRGALGLITTHDLALTEMVDELDPLARNVHFEDQLEDGRMSFDYRLRDGVIARGNALELMRAVGLEV